MAHAHHRDQLVLLLHVSMECKAVGLVAYIWRVSGRADPGTIPYNRSLLVAGTGSLSWPRRLHGHAETLDHAASGSGAAIWPRHCAGKSSVCRARGFHRHLDSLG